MDEILNSLSHLTPSQVHAALSYYFDHQEEIDADIAGRDDETYWKQKVLSPPNGNILLNEENQIIDSLDYS